ncbi:phosphoserine phosphatase SerB [Streptomyces hebeiensis]
MDVSEPRRTTDVPTLLVKIFGKDRPGITAGLFDTLAAYSVDVIDIEQVVTRGRIVLCALVAAPPGGAAAEGDLRATVHSWADSVRLQAEIISGTGDNRPRGSGRSHVTVLGNPLTAESTSAIAAGITASGGNIDRIFRLAKYPVTAVEFAVSGVGTEALRTTLAPTGASLGVDVAVVSAGLHRRAQRLVVMDVDSTLIQDEVIELFAAHAGCEAEVAEVTARAMRGELDFEESLHARVALLAGLDASVVDKVRADVRLTPGARTLIRTLKRLGYQVGVVSGGFTQVTDALQERLGLDFASANTLEIVDGRLTGRVVGEIVDRAGKARLLRRFAAEAGVPLAQTVAIGDGANDLDMLNAAGLGVAFNAKPVVREAAHTAVNVPFLDTVLYLLGITREEVEAADGEGGESGEPSGGGESPEGVEVPETPTSGGTREALGAPEGDRSRESGGSRYQDA